MTSHITVTSGNGSTAPVACTLTAAGLAAQASRWERLAARAMAERTETANGLRMSFRREPGVEEELRLLVAVENECCAWADWTVAINADQIVLDVHSTEQGIATMHGMFTSLHPAQPVHGD
jgi:hypothetical protein